MNFNKIGLILSQAFFWFSMFRLFAIGQHFLALFLISILLWVQYQWYLEHKRNQAIVVDIEFWNKMTVNSNTFWANLKPEDVFVHDLEGNLVPAFPEEQSTLSNKLDCVNCKYFHDNANLKCAVHPKGYEGDHCSDREN